MVLERLDRLSLDEARITASQILKVVYGLVQNMRVVMDGGQTHSACHPLGLRISPFRRQVIHRRYLGCPGYVWWCQRVVSASNSISEVMHYIVSDVNKSKRQ